MAGPVIHSLNCGTMCPRAAAPLGIIGRDPGHLVAHCLLIEAPGGLVLVDSGYTVADCEDHRRLGPARFLLGAAFRREETAFEQVKALGHDPDDVRFILATHLDLDHAGGLPDFPNAEVHVHEAELAAAKARKLDSRLRYRPGHIAHGPKWVTHKSDGEQWFGFERARVLEEIGVEIAMIPLHGHSVGHSGYAINTGDGWLLHCGDAYLQRCEVESPPRVGRGLRAYHAVNSVDSKLRRQNADRLSELARAHGSEVTVFGAHDAHEFDAVAALGAQKVAIA